MNLGIPYITVNPLLKLPFNGGLMIYRILGGISKNDMIARRETGAIRHRVLKQIFS